MSSWIVISYFIIAAFCVFSVIKLYATDKKSYAKLALSNYLLYTVIFLAIWIFKISVPSYLLLLSMLSILGSCFLGYYLGGFDKFKTFDRYLHAFSSFSYSLFVYCILDDFVDTGSSLLFQAIFIFLLGNTVGVINELLEMLHDRKKEGPRCQKGLQDTNMDMVSNLIGSAVAGIFAYFWLLP